MSGLPYEVAGQEVHVVVDVAEPLEPPVTRAAAVKPPELVLELAAEVGPGV